MSTRAVVALAALLAIPARAEGPSLRWSYARGAGAERCPDAEALRQAMAAQLGRDPFAVVARDPFAVVARVPFAVVARVPFAAPAAPDGASLRAEVRRVPGGLRARLELHDREGRLVGTRELYAGDCAELTAALTLAGAMAVDALASVAPPAPPAIERVAQANDDERPRLGDPAAPARTRTRVQVSAGLAAALDATTLIAPALTVQVDAIRPFFSVGVELRGNLPTGERQGLTAVSASLWSGTIVPCWRHKVAALCAIIAIGNERVDVVALGSVPAPLSAFWAAMGGRLAVELPLRRALVLRLHADLVAPLVPHQLTANDGTVAYKTPAISSSFGLALAALIP